MQMRKIEGERKRESENIAIVYKILKRNGSNFKGQLKKKIKMEAQNSSLKFSFHSGVYHIYTDEKLS